MIMKKIKRAIFILILLIILAYTTNITAIPNNIIIFQGEELNLGTTFGLYLKEKENKTVQTSSTVENENIVSKKIVTISLFNLFDIKDLEINTIPETTVIPLGNLVGLKLYTNGVLVVGKSEINGQKPYENTGIEEGDIIVEINQKEITCTSELIETVNSSNGEDLKIKYVRDGVEYTANMEAIKAEDNKYKLGLWVRDGAAGIGTITYYEPSNKNFAALGHGIIDIDTEKLIKISNGEVVTTRISSIVKGKEGVPGEIRGSIVNSKTIGTVGQNTEFGIYGKITNTAQFNTSDLKELQVAKRDEIKQGKAKILLAIEGGERKEYDIEITKIYKNNNSNNKSMLIKVTDEELLDLTGGIIQRNEWGTNNTKRKICAEQ
ncbi:MAG: SpoIVB peptidase S55 domain-containing protein [Clostridia bacterium]